MLNNKIRSWLAVVFTLIIISVITVWAKFRLEANSTYPIIFSERTMLTELWSDYKTEYLEPGTGRTLDKQRGNITTSEGQSYTMLRAVWIADKETFDSSWKWTQEILQRKEDKLFAWLFGQKVDGSYGIITESGGNNTASDADIDIALALIFAHGRWGESRYLAEAKLIIHDIWEKEVITINNRPYLTANNIEKASVNDIVINPSYFAPYAFRIFAEIDTAHNWLQLVDSSYALLEEAGQSNLDKDRSAGLPPDWLLLARNSGQILPSYSETNLTSNFGHDALRVPWRIALDWQWNAEPRAKAILDSYKFLTEEWKSKGRLVAGYGHDGTALNDYENHAFYGTGLSYFLVSDPIHVTEIYERKLKPLYSSDKQGWLNTLSYYDDNWVWFGLAMYNGLLINLAD
jgi:endoglucanase